MPTMVRGPRADDETASRVAMPEPGTGLGSTAWLTVIHRDVVRMTPLPRGARLVLGRDAEAEIRLADEGLSRRHAIFQRRHDRLFLADLGSKNGTFVNGGRVKGERELRHGDEVRAAGALVHVVLVAQLASPAEPPSPAGGADESGETIVAEPCMVQIHEMCSRIAGAFTSVLVLGETGVGKEIVARTIHRASPQRDGPFVALNCSTIPESVAETELFGCEKGAFTGAGERRTGYLEAAHLGTLFLDEVADLPLAVQAKLLRVLDTFRLSRLGSTREIEVDVRFVCATNHDVEERLAAGLLRRDLFYRLSQFVVFVPPLRSRPTEIPLLVASFARRMSQRIGRPAPQFTSEAIRYLVGQPWPGNIRALRNVVERAVVLAGESRIGKELLVGLMQPERPVARLADQPAAVSTAQPPPSATPIDARLRALEEQSLRDALAATAGNQARAARRIGISRRALIHRMAKYGIRSDRGDNSS
ncbi:MAG: sigma 54-interacting transcriptional regulator [Deltaproteobacteria bacterium]|nr:sigma 54-interacting transcriptional regulator [Deltaproteobacteria bacterium]